MFHYPYNEDYLLEAEYEAYLEAEYENYLEALENA